MNDRYLFRAKRIDNGEWIVGDLSHHKTGKVFVKPLNGSAISTCEVDKDTICQCTGLKDKNGNLIWENDVVKATVRQNSLCQSYSYSDFYQVSYHENYCYFYLKNKNNNLLFDGNWSYYLKSIDVIGNIFDNQELMYE